MVDRNFFCKMLEAQRCCLDWLFWKLSELSQENIHGWVSSLAKPEVQSVTLLKSNTTVNTTVIFLAYFPKFLELLILEKPLSNRLKRKKLKDTSTHPEVAFWGNRGMFLRKCDEVLFYNVGQLFSYWFTSVFSVKITFSFTFDQALFCWYLQKCFSNASYRLFHCSL